MRLFFDSSVLLAACASDVGASHEIIRLAPIQGWTLLGTPYVVREVVGNLPDLPAIATKRWQSILPNLVLKDDVLTTEWIAVFEPAKDRPILFSALAWAEVLLTLDRRDFQGLIESTFYGLEILTPGIFLKRERAQGRVRRVNNG